MIKQRLLSILASAFLLLFRLALYGGIIALALWALDSTHLTVSHSILAVAFAIVAFGALLGDRIVDAAKELGTAHVAAERVRSAGVGAPPEMPDLGAMLGGLFGGPPPEREGPSSEAPALDPEASETIVYLSSVTNSEGQAPSIPPGMLLDIERESDAISLGRLVELREINGIDVSPSGKVVQLDIVGNIIPDASRMTSAEIFAKAQELGRSQLKGNAEATAYVPPTNGGELLGRAEQAAVDGLLQELG